MDSKDEPFMINFHWELQITDSHLHLQINLPFPHNILILIMIEL